MAGRGPPPKVTGLSPKEGPPGTKVTIRGENLGLGPDDLIGLTIAGMDCLIYADWQSSSKIVARCMQRKPQESDVIVTTRSGGTGTSTVQFRAYTEPVSLTKDSAVWVEEPDCESGASGAGGRRHTASSPTALLPPDPLALHYDQEEDEPDGGTESLCEEDFDPAVYLMRRHRRASFVQLKSGLQQLRRVVDNMSRDPGSTSVGTPVALLKPNVLSVMECLDAMTKVAAYLKADRSLCQGQELTHKIEESVQKAAQDADSIFSDVLHKKETCDSTRNALHVLHRHRFLFNLPAAIERNVQKADYDAVIADYSRATTLFKTSDVRVFRRVMTLVEQRMQQLKDMLRQQLQQTCSRTPDPDTDTTTDELKKLIRFCVSLGVDGDPGWQTVTSIKSVLLQKMTECRDRHLASAQAGTQADSDPPHAVLFCEELVSLFGRHYPLLVRLAHEYLSGQLFVGRESEQRLKQKEAEFQTHMSQESVRVLVSLLRSALLTGLESEWPQDQSQWDLSVWLPHCLKTLVLCYQSLVRQDCAVSLMVSASLQPLQHLVSDFRVHCLTKLMTEASNEVRGLFMKEKWDVTVVDNVSGCRTQLPLLFEGTVVQQLQLIRETILNTGTGAAPADDQSPDNNLFAQIHVQALMKQLAQNLLLSMLTALQRTLTDHIPSVPKCHFSPDERLLLVLCNCIFVQSHVFPQLGTQFLRYQFPDMSPVLAVAGAQFRDMESQLVKQYTERKRDSVIGSIEPAVSLYSDSAFSCTPCHKPSDVSPHVKQLLIDLIAVQAQVFSVAPSLVTRVLVPVIEAAIEELSRVQQCLADRWNENANLQAQLDLRALRIAFKDLDCESTDQLLDSSFDHLRPIHGDEDRTLVHKLVNHMTQSMHLQLFCFRWQSETSVLVI